MPDLQAIWMEQPEEELAVDPQQIVNRRAEELHASTRSEILMSIAAALLFAFVMALRLAPYTGRFEQAGIAAVVLWALVSAYVFRGRIRRAAARPDAIAAAGLDYYRRELEQRRDHLRSAWLWHGPLLLSCLVLAAVLMGRSSYGADRWRSVLPLAVLLAAWVAFGFVRRLRRAWEIQREIDDL